MLKKITVEEGVKKCVILRAEYLKYINLAKGCRHFCNDN